MALFVDDFSGHTLDSPPSGWTSTWASAPSNHRIIRSDSLGLPEDVFGEFVFNMSNGSFGRVAFYPDVGATTGSKVEVYAVISYNIPTSTNCLPTLNIRGSGAESTRTGYVAWLRPDTNNYAIRKYTSGSESVLASGTLSDHYNAEESNSGHVHFEAEDQGGSVVLRMRAWKVGDPYPQYPDLEATDSSSPFMSGWNGIGDILGVAKQWGTVRIATDSDTALPEEFTVSAEPFLLRHNPRTNKVIPVLSSPTVTDIGANCVRPRVTKGY